MSTRSILSQELFDETILENEECFDLSSTEALHETITQFCQQLGYTAPSVVVGGNGSNNGNNRQCKAQPPDIQIPSLSINCLFLSNHVVSILQSEDEIEVVFATSFKTEDVHLCIILNVI